MTRNESAILFTAQTAENGVQTRYRLLRTVDPFRGDDVFSLFLTTGTQDACDEEFLYDITRDRDEAFRLLDLFCRMNVTACTVADVVSDVLA